MKYTILWTKTYHASGSEDIEAGNEKEAERIAHENIGNYEGTMQYDPDNNTVEVIQ